MAHNTDLIALNMLPVRIAVRVRRYDYWLRYPNDITLRNHISSGAKSEFQKIAEGWGDFLFYGFADRTETRLHAWSLVDLKQFRGWLHDHLMSGQKPWAERENADGSSFVTFDVDDTAYIVTRKQGVGIAA